MRWFFRNVFGVGHVSQVGVGYVGTYGFAAGIFFHKFVKLY